MFFHLNTCAVWLEKIFVIEENCISHSLISAPFSFKLSVQLVHRCLYKPHQLIALYDNGRFAWTSNSLYNLIVTTVAGN